jgi:hypothetical protein
MRVLFLGHVAWPFLFTLFLSSCGGHGSNFEYSQPFDSVTIKASAPVGTSSDAGLGGRLYDEQAQPLTKVAVLQTGLSVRQDGFSSVWPQESQFEYTLLASEGGYCTTITKKQETPNQSSGFHCLFDADRDGNIEVLKYRPLGKDLTWTEVRDFPSISYNTKLVYTHEFDYERALDLTGIFKDKIKITLRSNKKKGKDSSFLYNNSYDVTISNGKGQLILAGLTIAIRQTGPETINYTILHPFDEWATVLNRAGMVVKFPALQN